MKFSPSTGCFYPENINYKALPDDLIEVNEEQANAAFRRPPDAELRVHDGQLVITPPRPSAAHDWIKGQWVVNKAKQAELDAVLLATTAHAVRGERDRRLAESDWSQMPDAPISAEQREAWAAHRQALRDVPAQPGFPHTVNWPAAPAKG